MRKSTIAAIAAAALVGFGAVGSAMAADTKTSGWIDVRYIGSNELNQNSERSFTTWGEVDITHDADGNTLRFDLDLLNGGGVDGGTAGLGMGSANADPAALDTNLNVEQANLAIPFDSMATLTVGIWNTPIGYEGQDSPDMPYGANGLLWAYQPTNHAGARVDLTPTDMVNVTLGYANDWQGVAQENSIIATVGVTPVEGVDAVLGYITTDASYGNLLDFWVSYGQDMFNVYAEYMLGDPGTPTGGSTFFDNGWGIGGEVTQGMFGLAARYESAEIVPTGAASNPQPVATSVALFADLTDTDRVSVDWSNYDPDVSGSSDSNSLIVKYVRTFGDDMM